MIELQSSMGGVAVNGGFNGNDQEWPVNSISLDSTINCHDNFNYFLLHTFFFCGLI